MYFWLNEKNIIKKKKIMKKRKYIYSPVCIYFKTSAYKWIHVVQTHIVQGATLQTIPWSCLTYHSKSLTSNTPSGFGFPRSAFSISPRCDSFMQSNQKHLFEKTGWKLELEPGGSREPGAGIWEPSAQKTLRVRNLGQWRPGLGGRRWPRTRPGSKGAAWVS